MPKIQQKVLFKEPNMDLMKGIMKHIIEAYQILHILTIVYMLTVRMAHMTVYMPIIRIVQ